MMPWKVNELRKWSIVGMNHYYVDGVRHLYVAMMRGNRCIKAEDAIDDFVFRSLYYQAKSLNRQLDRELALVTTTSITEK